MRIAALLLVSAILSGCQQAAPPRIAEAQVLEFVRSYIEAANEGDATKLIGMYANDRGVTSASYGEVVRGWEEIRKEVDATISESTKPRFALATISVASLGPESAVAVAPFSVTLSQKKGTLSVTGAATFVVQRFPEGLRIIHDHFSLKLPN